MHNRYNVATYIYYGSMNWKALISELQADDTAQSTPCGCPRRQPVAHLAPLRPTPTQPSGVGLSIDWTKVSDCQLLIIHSTGRCRALSMHRDTSRLLHCQNYSIFTPLSTQPSAWP